jgi:hypothetical protein
VFELAGMLEHDLAVPSRGMSPIGLRQPIAKSAALTLAASAAGANRLPVIPENPIRADSRHEAESGRFDASASIMS